MMTLSLLLKTALPTPIEPVVPEAAVAHHRDRALAAVGVERGGAGAAEAVAHGGVADVERRQDREQVAADVAAHVMRAELALDQLHRGEDRPLRAAGAERRRAAVHLAGDGLLCAGEPLARGRSRRRRARRFGEQIGAMAAMNFRRPSRTTPPVYSPAIGSMSLPSTRVWTSARRRMVFDRLLDVVGLAFLDDQDRLLAGAEAHELVVDQRIGDVEHVERDAASPEDVGEAEQFERAQRGVVHAALQDDADVVGVAVEELVELVLLDELHRRRPALLDLLLLVQVGRRRQHDAVGVAQRVFQRVLAA